VPLSIHQPARSLPPGGVQGFEAKSRTGFRRRSGMNAADEPGFATLRVTGALDVYEAETVRGALLEALAAGSAVALDLGQVEACDTAGAQVLWAARRSAAQAGKAIRFEGPSGSILACWAALGLPADFFAGPGPEVKPAAA
jgi:anti-anti-sigma factor